MKYSGTIIRFISLALIVGSLSIYQTIAVPRAQQKAAIAAQLRAEEKKRREAAKEAADKEALLASAKYKDGEYEGEGLGYGGAIRVKVTVRDGEIYTIDVTEHSGEDDEYFNLALKMTDQIIDQNDTDIDIITGSTFSSEGLLEAINAALEKAVKK